MHSLSLMPVVDTETLHRHYPVYMTSFYWLLDLGNIYAVMLTAVDPVPAYACAAAQAAAGKL